MTVPALVSPRDLPEIRAELLRSYGNCFLQLDGEGHLHNSVRDAELFYVSGPMCDLAYRAASTLEAFPLRPWDLESTHGLIWFEKPIAPFGPIGFHLLSWSVVSDAVYIGLLMHREDVAEWARQNDEAGEGKSPTLEELEQANQPSFYRIMGRAVPWGEPVALATDDPGDVREVAELWVRFASALLLMRQKLATTERVRPARASQRRLLRENAPASAVRVISLRSISGETGNAASQREWAHQWVVRGHWRMQPCGSGRKERRPTWIAPHLKGPDGAPLLGGEKVYAWSR